MKRLVIILLVLLALVSWVLLQVKNNENGLEYNKLGSYTPQTYVSKNQEGKTNYVSYYPKDGINADMPVVLFIKGGGASIYSYSGLMKFMASKGYYVLGVDTDSYESWYVAKYIEPALDEIVQKHKLNLSKLAVMGHSLGGGQTFYVMKKLLEKGYGSKGSLILSIDGWFAFGMNEKDFSSLNTNVSFLQMNGVEGTGTDPRIHLKIWNLLVNSNKSFYTLKTNNHSYVAGELNNILAKSDLLLTVAALTDDAFKNVNRGKKRISKKYEVSYADVFNALKLKSSYRGGDCKGIQYNAIKELEKNNIDYCTLDK